MTADETTPPRGRIPPSPDPEAVPEGDPARVVRRRVRRRFGWFGRREETAELADERQVQAESE
ncbi:MAG: hypothetical protein ACRD0W_03205 [Acidimicrobiales bacterium]